MKTIQPITVWYNGQEVQATILKAVVSNDDMQSTATFNYQLMLETEVSGGYSYAQSVAQNFLTISGEAYLEWDTNDYAYEWIAQQLNLVIIGEYVSPVPPSPIPPLYL
jgi:hypothetical protein